MSAESSDIAKKNETSPKAVEKNGKKLGWSPLAAVFVTIFCVVLGQIFGGIVISALAILTGQPEEWFDRTDSQFVFVLASSAFTFLILWLLMRRRGVRWPALGFKRRPQWYDLAYALIGGAVYFVMLIVAGAMVGPLLGVDVNQEQEIGFEQAAGGAALALVFVSLVVLPPFLEEVVFRGFLFTSLRSKLTLPVATLITSVLFAAPHLLASSTGPLWIAAIDTFILSLVLCYLRERTGNLWAPIALHALKNGAVFTFLFVVL